MKFNRIFFLLIYFSILTLTNSCGVGVQDKTKLITFALNAQMQPVENLNSVQRNIAANICSALKLKAQNYMTTDFLGTRFIFKTVPTTCGTIGATANIISTLAMMTDTFGTTSFHYNSSSTTNFNDFAQTDNSGYLAQVCNKINTTQDISNTTTINGIPVQIIFFKDTLEG